MRRKTKMDFNYDYRIDGYMDTIAEVAVECDRLLNKKLYFKEGNLNLYLAQLKREFKTEIAKMVYETKQKACMVCQRR